MDAQTLVGDAQLLFSFTAAGAFAVRGCSFCTALWNRTTLINCSRGKNQNLPNAASLAL